jgi:hypothetical protein
MRHIVLLTIRLHISTTRVLLLLIGGATGRDNWGYFKETQMQIKNGDTIRFVSTGKSQKDVRKGKDTEARRIQNLISEWVPPDPCEDWHAALAEVVESVDIFWASPDEDQRRNMIAAVDRARYLLKDD